MKFLQHLNEAVENKTQKELSKQYGLYLQKMSNFKSLTHEEYCQLLTKLYYPLYAYRFEPTKAPQSYYDFMVSGDIIVYLSDATLSLPMTPPTIEENQIFAEIAKLINQAIELIKNIDKLKMDLGYLASWPLKQYLSKNIDPMSRKAGNEITLHGGTKIEALYAVIFGEDSEIYKKVEELVKLYTNDVYMNMNEEYVTRISDDRHSAEIFQNPSKKELMQAAEDGGHIRFVIDTHNTDLYVWNYNLLHESVADELGFEYPCFGNNDYLYGAAGIKHGYVSEIMFFDAGDVSDKGKKQLKSLVWTKRYLGASLIHHIERWYKVKF